MGASDGNRTRQWNRSLCLQMPVNTPDLMGSAWLSLALKHGVSRLFCRRAYMLSGARLPIPAFRPHAGLPLQPLHQHRVFGDRIRVSDDLQQPLVVASVLVPEYLSDEFFFAAAVPRVPILKVKQGAVVLIHVPILADRYDTRP